MREVETFSLPWVPPYEKRNVTNPLTRKATFKVGEVVRVTVG